MIKNLKENIISSVYVNYMPSSLVINCNLYKKTYQFHSMLLINALPLNNAVNKKSNSMHRVFHC